MFKVSVGAPVISSQSEVVNHLKFQDTLRVTLPKHLSFLHTYLYILRRYLELISCCIRQNHHVVIVILILTELMVGSPSANVQASSPKRSENETNDIIIFCSCSQETITIHLHGAHIKAPSEKTASFQGM